MRVLLSHGIRRFFSELLFVLVSVIAGRKPVLRLLFRLLRSIEGTIDYVALWDSPNGLHPKHRLTDYHDFFQRRISSDQTVLDVGCGCGAVAVDIARHSGARVIGIDKDASNITAARSLFKDTNTEFVCADVMKVELPDSDVIVLSNVLEHLDERVTFLRRLRESLHPKVILVRVPQFERNWLVPYACELGLDTRLDPTHYIEHRQEEIIDELKAAGWRVQFIEARWGEYRIEAVPDKEQ